jgi:hypothetical protein
MIPLAIAKVTLIFLECQKKQWGHDNIVSPQEHFSTTRKLSPLGSGAAAATFLFISTTAIAPICHG